MSDIVGSGKDGGHTPVEYGDNLFSTQVVRALFAVSEGVINSVDSVLLNEVDSSKFTATVYTRLGYTEQEKIPIFKAVEAALEGFSPIALTRGIGPTPLRNTVNIPYEIEAVRLGFTINTLRAITSQGDIVGTTVELMVYARANADVPYSQAEGRNCVKTGKTSSGYTFDLVMKRPTAAVPGTPWVVTVSRVTADSTTVKVENSISWTGVTKIIYQTLTYPKTALVGLELRNPKQFGGRIPDIRFKVKGITVQIPSNYNPITREYSGTWGGEFKLYKWYTNNPAWCLYDLLTDTRYGLSIPSQDIDRYSFYFLAKYSDELISDGSVSGQIPRYTFDYQFSERDSPQAALSQILSVCCANIVINEFGQIAVVYLNPSMSISRNVTCQNVVEGIFNYSSSDLEQRSNLVNITYNNGEYFGRTNTVTVSDQTLIDRYGLQPIDIALPGCYYEAQAIRKARSILFINSYFTNIVSFSVLFEGLTYKLGDLIRVYDDYNQIDLRSGIVIQSTVDTDTTITFDRDITLNAGGYTLYVYDVNGEEHTKILTYFESTTISSVTLTGNHNFPVGTTFVISGATVAKIYRVSAIQKSEDEIYTITAVEFDFDLFTYINSGITVESNTGDFVNANYFDVTPVSNLTVIPNSSTNGVTVLNKLGINWEWSTSTMAENTPYFRLMWCKDNGVHTLVDKVPSSEYDLLDVTPGVYTITVWAVNPYTDILSTPVTLNYEYKLGGQTSTLYPPTNVRITGTTSTYPDLSFATSDVSISFDYNTNNTIVEDALYDYLVELWDSSGTTLYEKYTVQPIARAAEPDPIDPTNETYIPLDGVFILPYAENVAQFGTPTRTFKLKIYSRDTLGDLSVPITVNVTNPAPVVTAFTVQGTFNSVNINVTLPSDLDLKGFIYKRYAAAGDTSPLEVISSLNNNIVVQVTAGTTYYYTVTATDSYGAGSESTKQSASAVAVEPDTYTYTGLVFKPNDPSSNYVSWTQFVATKNGTTSVTVSAGSAQWTTGILYLYYLPGVTTLGTSTSLVSAIGAGGRILGTYKGGTDLQSDEGRAFTSGDMILAGTVGASTLVTNTAIITSSAQIGADIQSQLNPTTGLPHWIIQQNGYASFTNINIYNSSGQLILSSGQQVQGATFGGRSFTAGTLTLAGTANISGNSINKI